MNENSKSCFKILFNLFLDVEILIYHLSLKSNKFPINNFKSLIFKNIYFNLFIVKVLQVLKIIVFYFLICKGFGMVFIILFICCKYVFTNNSF